MTSDVIIQTIESATNSGGFAVQNDFNSLIVGRTLKNVAARVELRRCHNTEDYFSRLCDN